MRRPTVAIVRRMRGLRLSRSAPARLGGHGAPGTITHHAPAGLQPRVRARHRAQSRLRHPRGRLRAAAPNRWRCSPTPGTICPTCSGWSSPGPARRWRASRASRALHLRAQEGVDPRRADQCPVPAGRGRGDRRRSDPPAVRARAGRGADGDDLGRRASAIVVNGVTAMLFARGREQRHQHPRRLPAHGRRRRGLGGGGRRRLRHPEDRAAVDRPGDEPGGRRGDPVGQLRPAQGIGRHVAGRACRSGIALDEVEAALRRLDGVDGGPRPPRLAAEHDRDRADRASRRARGRGRPTTCSSRSRRPCSTTASRSSIRPSRSSATHHRRCATADGASPISNVR